MYLPQGLLAACRSFHEIRFWQQKLLYIRAYHNPDVRGYIVSSHDTSLYMTCFYMMQKITCKLNMNQYQGFFPLFVSLESDKSFLEIMQDSMLSATMGDQHTLKSTHFHIIPQ